MPNWCANRLRVTGPEEEVSKVKALMEGGAATPVYERAAGEGGSPLSPEVLCALTARYGVTAEHWYAEAGCDYCGWATYSGGVQLDERCEMLEWNEEADEYGYRDVAGPEWIIDNVASYGG